jgi:hypothetical protein
LRNLRGQSPIPKPDAANPRQVDAVVRTLVLNFFIETDATILTEFDLAGYPQLPLYFP